MMLFLKGYQKYDKSSLKAQLLLKNFDILTLTYCIFDIPRGVGSYSSSFESS